MNDKSLVVVTGAADVLVTIEQGLKRIGVNFSPYLSNYERWRSNRDW
jgi:hypothetical protein